MIQNLCFFLILQKLLFFTQFLVKMSIDNQCHKEELHSCSTASTSFEIKEQIIDKELNGFSTEELVKMNGNTEVPDAELKILLGRLVDRSKDGEEIKVVFYKIVYNNCYFKSLLATQIVSTNDRRWLIFTQHLCMERLQRIDKLSAEQRASYKLAHYFSLIDSQLVTTAFKQLLKHCCNNFEGLFDALFQRVAAVIDFAKRLKFVFF